MTQQKSKQTRRRSRVPGQARPCVCIVYAFRGISGAFVAIQRQAEILGDEIDFILVMPRSNPMSPDQLAPFARVVRLPMVPLRKGAAGLLKYFATLVYSSISIRRLLQEERCDRVQMNCFTTHHGTLLRLLGYRGRIVTWIRSDPCRVGWTGRASLGLARWCSDALVAVSDYVRRLLPWPDDATLVYDPARAMPFVGATAGPDLVQLGNYSHMKAQDFAIRAFHNVAERHPQAKLIFHGLWPELTKNQTYFNELQKLAEAGPGAGRIEFHNYADVTEALEGKRAALMVSRWEPFGLACQDASAHGLPVIATRSGGPEEMVDDGRTGFLIDIDDVDALADRMDRLLSEPELARTMGQKGLELMRQRFPVERFKEEMREVLAL